MTNNVIDLKSRLGATHPLRAENDLLDLVLGKDASEFSLNIRCFNGSWSVILIDHTAVPTDPPSNRCDGEGGDFNEAWANLTPTWVKS